ncbi:NAD(P)H-binding protein [Nonomuraea sp. NPDC050790]|uniref:NAD(P)H-binding protein n=1 Tax=Nonomuraea sp. NPDC050790 TaxID=3364371 RepID=UPI0037BB73DA
MILITGATGTIGSEVTRLLAEAGVPATAMTRDPGKVAGPAVRGDFGDVRSLEAAVTGVSTALLLTAFGAELAAHERAFVDVAARAGVRKVVKISVLGAPDSDDPEDTGGLHAAGERALTGSGMAWTILRPSMFATNALGWAAAVRAGQPIPNVTGRGRLGVIDPRDIAAVAVAALTGSAHDGRAYDLTGPDLLSTHDQAELIGRAIGRRVETVDVPIEQALAQVPDPVYARAAAKGWAAIAADTSAILTTTVQDVLGRPAGSFESWARENKAAFGG